MTQDILITPGSGEPQILFRGSGTNDTPIELNVLSSYQSATGSGTALVFEGQEGQLFAVTDNLSSGTIFSVGDITGLSMLSVDASGDVKLGEFANSVIVYPGLTLDDNVPSTTSNVLYNDGGDLMWNGVTVIQSGAAQAVDGSGTASYVARFTDTNTLGTGVIYDNGTNVGIGTASPGQKLHISTTGHTELQIDAGVDSNPGVRLTNDAQNWVMRLAGDSSDQFQIRQITGTPANRLVIDTSGKVGIGADSPTQKLDIRYPAGGGMALLKSTDTTDGLLFGDMAYSTSNTHQGIKHAAMTGTSDYMIMSAGGHTNISAAAGSSVFIKAGGNDNNSLITLRSTEIVVNDEGSNLDFRVESNNDAYALFVDGVSDYVGIGTASPSAKLDVKGTWVSNQGLLSLDADNGTRWAGLTMQNNGTAYGYLYHDNTDSYVELRAATSNGIRFFTNNAYRMFITSLGDVGIGTASPSEKLHVAGDVLIDGDGGTIAGTTWDNGLLKIGSSSGGISIDTNEIYASHDLYLGSLNSASAIILRHSNIERMRVASNGYVGIGTSSPQDKLHVNGGRIRIENVTDPKLSFNDGSANRSEIFYDTSEETFVLNHTDADANQLVLTSGNNVGIGTNDPNATLHVYSAASGDNIFNVEGTNGSLFGVTDNLSGVLMSVNTIAGLPVLEVNSDYSVTAGRFNQNDFAISSSGNVGIGTASPSQKLHVDGNLRLTGAFYDSNNAAGTSGQVLSSTATGTDWISLSEIQGVDGTGTAGQVAFWSDADTITGESNLYWDSSNDRLGIGTSSPLTPLHVKDGGSGSDGIRIDYGPNNTYNLRLDGVGGIRQWRGTGSNAGMTLTTSLTSGSWGGDQGGLIAFQPRDTEAARFDGLGNFGIGTASPTHKLHIKGAVDSSTGSYSQLMIESEATTYPDTIAGIALNSVASHQSHIRFLNNGAAKFQIRYNTANTTEDKLKIFSFTQSADMVTFDGATDRVGIGTTGPSGSLHVEKSTVGGNNIYFRNTNNGSGSYQSLRLGNDTALTKFVIFTNSSTRTSDGGAGNTTIRTDSGDLILGASGNERIRITSGGNVGIGTTLPDSALHVYSSATTDHTLKMESTAGNSSVSIIANTTTKVPSVDFYGTSTIFGRIGIDRTSNIITGLSKNDMFVTTSQSSNKLHLATNSISRVTVDTDGNVGIGTTSPNAVLHAYGSTPSGTVFNVEGTNGSLFSVVDNLSGVLMSVNNNAGLPVFEVNDDDSIIAGRFAQDDFVITSSGDIGMGIAAPSGKLHVVGEAYVDNLRLDGNTLSSTNTNGVLILNPNGTGALQADSGGNARGAYAVDLQRVRTADTQVASATASNILGGCRNTNSGSWSTISGGYSNLITGVFSNIGGGYLNRVSSCCSTIGGGVSNCITVSQSVIAGGRENCATGGSSNTVSGGCLNCSEGFFSVVGGGCGNRAAGNCSVVSGGRANYTSINSTVSGGLSNSAAGNGAVIGGGISNISNGSTSTVGGGCSNSACATNSSISGGCKNFVNARHGSINGGHYNAIQSPTNECCSRGATIGGGIGHNTSGGTVDGTTGDITGTVTCCNAGRFSTISGGLRNVTTGPNSTVGGGCGNTASGCYSTIAGGWNNTANCNQSTVSGGYCNCADESYATIGGGYSNTVTGACATISGGAENTASGGYSTVGGGGGLFAGNTASCNYSTVGGGRCNCSAGTASTVSGGYKNTASGYCSTVSGGSCNCACACVSTVVGGYQAKASRYGEVAHAAGRFSASGDAQHSTFVARRQTTAANNFELFLDGSSQRMIVPSQSMWAFTIKISAFNVTQASGGAWWYIRGGIQADDGGDVSLVGSLIEESDVHEDFGASYPTISADTGNSSLKIQVSTDTSDTLRWVAVVDVAQVSGGTP